MSQNLIDLIHERDKINISISHILKDELDKVRKKYYGNGHFIENIEICGESIVLTILYDDWETSRRCRHIVKVKDYE